MAVSCPLLAAVLTFTLESPLSVPSLLPPPKKKIKSIFEESYNETSGRLVAAIKLNEHFWSRMKTAVKGIMKAIESWTFRTEHCLTFFSADMQNKIRKPNLLH